eukprot:11200_1
MTEANKIILQKTCKTIGEYYKLMGKTDVYYAQDDGNKGKFSKWFEEEDLDVDDLQNDFSDIEECCYLVFDEDFPLPQNIIKFNYKEKIQFKIMQYCYDNCASQTSPTLDDINQWYEQLQSERSDYINKNKYISEDIKYNDEIDDNDYNNDNDNDNDIIPRPAFGPTTRLERSNSITEST